MQHYIKIILLSSFAFAIAAPTLNATCPRCIEIRENNKKNSGNEFFYYEDYLENQEEIN